MMAGLGLPAHDFDRMRLLPAARRYRAWLDRVSNNRDWIVGAAALTVFVEGSVKDRQKSPTPPSLRPPKTSKSIVQRHPLVSHHGLPIDSMDLIRAHQMVEAGHRHDAYAMVVNYATTHAQQQAVLRCLKKCLRLWQAYRDAVAKACGLKKP